MPSSSERPSNEEKARQSSIDYASHLEDGNKEKKAAQRNEDVHIQWTFMRVVAIISMSLVDVGMLLCFESGIVELTSCQATRKFFISLAAP
jgi:hypothetical protein